MRLPSTLSGGESLARYLTHRNHYNELTSSVMPGAFDPPPDLRLSVFRIDGLSDLEVWENGQVNVIDRMLQPRSLYGFADIKVVEVQATSLTVDPDNTPPRHACIVGWPEGESNKSKRKLLAQELASKAKLKLRRDNS